MTVGYGVLFRFREKWASLLKLGDDPERFAAALDLRDEELEDYLDVLGTRPSVAEATFSYAGPFTVASSPRWYGRDSGTAIYEIVTSLDTAGSSTTTVVVRVNGITLSTVTLGSGVNLVVTVVARPLVLGDYVTCAVTGVGTGAASLTVQVRVRAAA